jgi:hypothetical protein
VDPDEKIDGKDYALVIDQVAIDLGDHSRVATRGETLEWVPEGTLKSLLQRRHMVPIAKLVEDEQSQPEPQSPLTVEKLGLSAAVVKALTAAGLGTVDDILDWGAENGGLQGIEGVGPKAEQEIQAALAKALA